MSEKPDASASEDVRGTDGEPDGANWPTVLIERLERDQVDDSGYLDQDEIRQLIGDAYRSSLETEILMASRKACAERGVRVHGQGCQCGDRKMKILAVDDEKGYLSLVTQSLERTGRYETRSVSIPNEAMDVIDSFEPDMALLDIVMPGMTGLQIVDLIRADERWRGLPLIMMSGLISDVGRKALSAKGLLYVAKSISPRNLVHCINEQLNEAIDGAP